MPFKLTYFNVKGLGEPIRFIFAYNGVEFEDIRIPKEDWMMRKGEQPFGQLPVLDTGDAILTQSTVIARYLGKTFGLAPENDDMRTAQLDALVGHMADAQQKLGEVQRQGGDVTAFEHSTLALYFYKLNMLAEPGWFYSSTPTWADIYFAGFIDCMETRMNRELLDNYPNLNNIKRAVNANSFIQEYLSKRPYCDQ